MYENHVSITSLNCSPLVLCFREQRVAWEITVRDRSVCEGTFEQSHTYYSDSSVTLCWTNGSWPAFHQLSTIQLHGVKRVPLKCPSAIKWVCFLSLLTIFFLFPPSPTTRASSHPISNHIWEVLVLWVKRALVFQLPSPLPPLSPPPFRPGWRSLMAQLDIDTISKSSQVIGGDRLVKLVLLSPGIVIGIWRVGQHSQYVLMMSWSVADNDGRGER